MKIMIKGPSPFVEMSKIPFETDIEHEPQQQNQKIELENAKHVEELPHIQKKYGFMYLLRRVFTFIAQIYAAFLRF